MRVRLCTMGGRYFRTSQHEAERLIASGTAYPVEKGNMRRLPIEAEPQQEEKEDADHDY